MNRHLTPKQVEEILEGSEHVAVPSGRLIATAREIRGALLTSDPAMRPTPAINQRALYRPPPSANVWTRPLQSPRGRSRRRQLVLVGTTLGVATTLSFASAGALPQSAQAPVARLVAMVGINLPTPDAHPEPGGGGDTRINSEPSSNTAANANLGAGAAAGSPSASSPSSDSTSSKSEKSKAGSSTNASEGDAATSHEPRVTDDPWKGPKAENPETPKPAADAGRGGRSDSSSEPEPRTKDSKDAEDPNEPKEK